MTILSKPLYSIIDGVNGDPTLVEGFNTKYGEDLRDVHFWCEDEFGKVYDTTPFHRIRLDLLNSLTSNGTIKESALINTQTPLGNRYSDIIQG